jgi:N-methylhydantoinase A
MFERPRLLVPPSRTVEVDERIGPDGSVLRPLGPLEPAIESLEQQQVESVAICLLFAFANPEHEQRLAEAMRARHPEWLVTASSDLLPQIREYYRLSTTVINAYIAPKLADYLGRLESGLRAAGVQTPQMYVMQSSGGAATFPAARERGVATLLSGPAGGVVAGIEIGRLAGAPNVITFDMGGTSCDVSLAEDGRAQRTTRSSIGGRHIALSALDIHTVSAGGGTLAWVDERGGLHVGPQSAGAEPGPVAYGRGGRTPTVTDCNLVLGYLNAAFLGGEMVLDRDAAWQAIEERLARPLGIDTLRAAAGVVELVNVKMEEAIKAISTQRGYDLGAFALVAFGGAGPVHAAQIALDLNIPRVIAPPAPGAASALGLLMSPVRHDYVLTRLGPLADCTPDPFLELERQALRDLEAEGFSAARRQLTYLIDLRYEHQGYELSVPVPWPALLVADLRERFDALHEHLYGHAAPDQPVEVVSYRVVGTGQISAPRLAQLPAHDSRDACAGHRQVFFSDPMTCPIYDRAGLGAGATLDGPAIVEQYDSTIVVPPTLRLRVDGYGNAVLERHD